MKTIKVYTSKKDSKTKLELHFNLWNSTKNKLKSLDIGVMAPIEDNVYDVILTIPGKYEEKDIQDLGKILIQKQAVANNVFNCNINKIGTGNDFRISVTKDNNFNFIIQQFIPRFKDNDEDKDGQEKQNCFINDAKITIHLKIQKDENYKSEFIFVYVLTTFQ